MGGQVIVCACEESGASWMSVVLLFHPVFFFGAHQGNAAVSDEASETFARP